jgi:hypothetical protein
MTAILDPAYNLLPIQESLEPLIVNQNKLSHVLIIPYLAYKYSLKWLRDNSF